MLGIFLAVGVFHDHKLQQETDGRVRLHGKMNVLIGKAIGLWLEKKAEQRCIRINNGEIVTEKGIPLNQNANDNDFFLIGSRSAQGIATIWLPDIALPLANSNQAVILCREGGITVLIGIIDKEKILSMERLI